MPRYIDADALPMWDELFMKGKNDSGVWVRYKDVERLIRNAPTADVEEAKHGEWKEIIDEKEVLFFRQKFYCSACGEWNTYGMTAYCPKCGARMEGKNGKD